MAASVPPVPPVRAMLPLVIVGRELKSVTRAEEIARALRDSAAGVTHIEVVQDRHRVGCARDGGAAVEPDQDAIDGELHPAVRRWFRRSCGRSMPPQSPAKGCVSGLLLVAPPIVASLYDVKLTGLLAVPCA